jgi:hypothetical protein
MERRILAALLILGAVSAFGENVPPQPVRVIEAFPSAKQYYYPLMADPIELGYSGRYLFDVGDGRYGEVTVGDYLGVVGWQLPYDWIIQANLAGGVIARFNLNTELNALQVTDFTAGIPLDFNHGNQTIRVGMWHTSSHLGDDFLRTNNVMIEKRSDDMLKLIYSLSANEWLRVYGGGSYAFHVINIDGRGVFQAGVELYGPFTDDHRWQLFLAQDLQTLQRVGWNPQYTIRSGVRITDSKRFAAARLFLEYFTGHYYFLQLYEQKESRWGLGLALELGNPTK